MTKREKKLIIDRYIQVKNLVEWYSYKLSKQDVDETTHEYHKKRQAELDHESITLGSLASDLGIWDAVWDAYWDQRKERRY